MNHTPGPWKAAGITTERLQGDQNSIEADFIHIEAEGYTAGGGIGLIHNKPNGVGMANAQFLLTACNAHEELVALLEEAVSGRVATAADWYARACVLLQSIRKGA